LNRDQRTQREETKETLGNEKEKEKGKRKRKK
jgi:hypothetical protein